jgi:hypothetical protein
LSGDVRHQERHPAASAIRRVAALEGLGTREALATLRALVAVSAPRYAAAARPARRHAPAEPAWAADIGAARPAAAALMREEASTTA